MQIFAQTINIVAELLTLLVIIWAVLGWIISPYHPAKQALDRIVEPLLAPIRRVLPPVGTIDFSPLVFIIVVQVLAFILVQLLG